MVRTDFMLLLTGYQPTEHRRFIHSESAMNQAGAAAGTARGGHAARRPQRLVLVLAAELLLQRDCAGAIAPPSQLTCARPCPCTRPSTHTYVRAPRTAVSHGTQSRLWTRMCPSLSGRGAGCRWLGGQPAAHHRGRLLHQHLAVVGAGCSDASAPRLQSEVSRVRRAAATPRSARLGAAVSSGIDRQRTEALTSSSSIHS